MKKDPPKNNHFFMISFLPAMAYWYLEANYSLRIAIAGGLILAIAEIIAEKVFTKHVHKISIFNFYLILLLGGLSLLGDEGIWFKLQPFFTGVFMGGYLYWRCRKGNGLMWEMMQAMNRPMPAKEIWEPLERRMSLFMFFYGLFMAAVAIWMSTDHWLFFKTAGFYIVFVLYFVVETLVMRKKLMSIHQKKYK